MTGCKIYYLGKINEEINAINCMCGWNCFVSMEIL